LTNNIYIARLAPYSYLYFMPKRILYIVILAVLLVGVVGWISIRKPVPAQNPPSLERVTVAQAFEVFIYAPLYVAQEKGFFKDEGLEINIVTAGGDEKAFAALLSKDAQFAIGDPTFVAVAGERGQPGKVVASLLSGVPFWGVAHKSSVPEIADPKQLGGYTVATFPAPSTAFALQTKMFQSAGLAPRIREVAFGGLLAALKSNQVDIALELEPNVSTAVAGGDRVVYSLAQYYPEFAITGVTVLPAYADQSSRTVQAFVNALRKADIFIQTHPAEAAEIMSKQFSEVSPAVAANALRNIVQAKVIPDTMSVSKSGWDAAISLRRDVGDITQPAPYETYVTTTFSRTADQLK
jgi:NitT/TauT family transport system substrate-binding protein